MLKLFYKYNAASPSWQGLSCRKLAACRNIRQSGLYGTDLELWIRKL